MRQNTRFFLKKKKKGKGQFSPKNLEGKGTLTTFEYLHIQKK